MRGSSSGNSCDDSSYLLVEKGVSQIIAHMSGFEIVQKSLDRSGDFLSACRRCVNDLDEEAREQVVQVNKRDLLGHCRYRRRCRWQDLQSTLRLVQVQGEDLAQS